VLSGCIAEGQITTLAQNPAGSAATNGPNSATTPAQATSGAVSLPRRSCTKSMGRRRSDGSSLQDTAAATQSPNATGRRCRKASSAPAISASAQMSEAL